MVLLSVASTTFLVLHIASAIYFTVGAVLAVIFTLQIPNTPTLAAKARVMRQSSRVALLMIVPGTVIAGITGVLLAVSEDGATTLHHGWIVASIVLFAAAFIVGGASGPTSAKLRRQVEAEARSGKRPSATLIQGLRSPVPFIVTGINLAITVALIVLMFAKPGS